jgi:hypothetical protein
LCDAGRDWRSSEANLSENGNLRSLVNSYAELVCFARNEFVRRVVKRTSVCTVVGGIDE